MPEHIGEVNVKVDAQMEGLRARVGAAGFPHKPLTPWEATPRIKPETAAALLVALEKLRERDPETAERYSPKPAICVAFFVGPLLKWVVNEVEAEETLARMREAASGTT